MSIEDLEQFNNDLKNADIYDKEYYCVSHWEDELFEVWIKVK
jgi:hypothetical protein